MKLYFDNKNVNFNLLANRNNGYDGFTSLLGSAATEKASSFQSDVCLRFMQSGDCKYGDTCKYSHDTNNNTNTKSKSKTKQPSESQVIRTE